MTVHTENTVSSVHCDACAGALGRNLGEVSDDWDDDTWFFDNERIARLVARHSRWYVGARKILCPACWALEIQAMQEEE